LEQLLQQRRREDFASDYPVGPGDVIEVNVAGMEEIRNFSQRVTGEGTISLPFVGVIKAGGLTDKALRAEIRARLETHYMRDPQVSLFVREFRSRQVAVIGAVQKPGLYNLTGSGDSILSMVSQAGGMSGAFAERILFIPAEAVTGDKAQELASALPAHLIQRDPAPLILKDVEPLVIDLAAMNRGGNENYLSMPVRPGDVIMIPGSGDVLVQGWVEKPGSYKITPGLTVLGVVAAAGGAMYAADTRAVKLFRTGAQGRKTVFISDLDAIAEGRAPDLPLLEGDVIDIASSGPKAVAYGVYRFFTTIMRVGASVPIPVGR
jgi:polysaccharide export outer membrane protein